MAIFKDEPDDDIENSESFKSKIKITGKLLTMVMKKILK